MKIKDLIDLFFKYLRSIPADMSVYSEEVNLELKKSSKSIKKYGLKKKGLNYEMEKKN